MIARFHEVEIEREQAGTVHDVVQLAEQLSLDFALAPATESKFSAGLKLLYGPFPDKASS